MCKELMQDLSGAKSGFAYLKDFSLLDLRCEAHQFLKLVQLLLLRLS